MAKKKMKTMTTLKSIVIDGSLKEAEALQALSLAAQSATAALPKALAKCKTIEDEQKVMADRDTCMLAYLMCMEQSLKRTGPHFEAIAADLENAANEVNKKADNLKNSIEAINLFADMVRLAGSLALAFG
ncbi:MAG: hypothetical protein ACI8ZB_005489 [Desulforhopalus sp.]|jgi:hypothetical protein